ncbi:MAG: hypothetical protein JWR63_1001 [Conexibacter sp.]|nr:hypothetical protein [Conexibacter sp.]
MDPDGIWVLGRGDGDFRRVNGIWVHARGAGRRHELRVPGARDVTFEELHGHRILDPRLEPSLDRHHWRLKGAALFMRFPDASGFPELGWARTQERQQHPTLGLLCGFPTSAWVNRRETIAGLWAPQFVRNDFRGSLAGAGLDEQVAARDAKSAAAYRRALMRRGAQHFELSHRALAEAARVSRGRIPQILRESGFHGDAAARSALTADAVLARLAVAAESHRSAGEQLAASRRARATAVREARRQKLSLAQIALCLGVTRGRVQQLAKP